MIQVYGLVSREIDAKVDALLWSLMFVWLEPKILFVLQTLKGVCVCVCVCVCFTNAVLVFKSTTFTQNEMGNKKKNWKYI